MTSPILISIIIRTFNEQKHLNALFDAIDEQTVRDYETIVVDSGSFDRTRDIAAKRAHQLIRISSHDFTFGYSLNVGIKAAKGRYIVAVSAHTIPANKDWLEALVVPLINDKKVAMTYGRQSGMACSKFSEAEDFERTFGIVPRSENGPVFAVNNANSAIKKELWNKYPFDEKLTGLEDVDWARHWLDKGHQVLYQPDAHLYHIHEETWRQIRHRYYREAVAWRQMVLLRRRNIPETLIKESLYSLKDFFQAFFSNTNPVSERLALGQRLREIVYFRVNKNTGTLRGLLASHPMETRTEQELILFGRTMDAVVIQGPGKAVLENVELPKINPGDILIQVSHVAVCATDLEIFDGSLGYYDTDFAQYPIIPGHEFSGRVAAMGQKVTGFSEGDPVVAECIQSCGSCPECQSGNFIGCKERSELGVLNRNGAYASYVVVPSRFVHKLPPNTDLKMAALAEPLAVILKALRRIGPVLNNNQKTLRCAVIGSGPLGHLCSKVLHYRGYSVTAFDRNETRRALFDGTGIKTSKKLDDLSNFNFIVEITGDPEVLDKALRVSPANSTILILGLPYGQRIFSFENIAAYDKTITGSVGSTKEDFQAAIKLLSKLELAPYFSCVMELSEFAEAWNKSKTGEVLKVILSPA